MAERRLVTVYLPPNYRRRHVYPAVFCADGQSVTAFSERLDFATRSAEVPSTILIGVHSNVICRAQEYVIGVNEERFAAHERFFTAEVYQWTVSEFGFSGSRDSGGVFGFSNGGAFALSIGARHREKYGVVIAFSIAGGPHLVPESEYARRPIARYYLSAGTREKPFRDTGRAVAKLLARHGVDHVYTERHASHEFGFWNRELPEAIRWSFPASGGPGGAASWVSY